MAERKMSQKKKALVLDLNCKEEKKISRALKAIEIHGDSSLIRPLAERLLSDMSELNKKELLELLSSLKDTSVSSEMMEVIGEKEFISVRQPLLSTIWNMKVDFSDYVSEFVGIACEGDFMEALDCLTIIENLAGPFMEESILESQLHLKEYLENKGLKDDQKAYILSEIALKIKDFNMDLHD